MFKTVKSKILIIAIIMLTVLMFAFGCYTVYSRMKTKQLMVQNYGFSMNEYTERLDDEIIYAENNLNGLALIGNVFYRTDRSTELTNRIITRIFENYPKNLGGGIWFLPYKIDKSKKYVCFYAYRNKDNKIIIDEKFSSEEYDYPNQEWYKSIISQITPERNIVWTRPYYENLGSYSTMVTAGTGIYVDGELIGIATVDWKIDPVIEELSKIKPMEKTFSMYKRGNEIKNSFALFANEDEDYIIATNDPYLDGEKLIGHSLKEIPWYTSFDKLYSTTYIKYHGQKYVPFARRINNGMILIICIPQKEMFKYVNEFYLLMIIVMLLLGLIIPTLLYLSMNRYIINPIDKLTEIANKISKGEDIQIKLEKPEEFAQLASTYDKMTNHIKAITKEKAKMSSELSIANIIQSSSLPSVFPPYPDKKEFDIFASMEPAKEVGGDFYDFYFVDENKLMFLVADVSGKGIPAALFMMTVKTLISYISQMEHAPKKLIETINRKVCENNKNSFFVTMLSGIIDITTGEMSIINCGHNLPLIKRKDGNYEYLKLKSNIALGVFEDADFEIYETVMKPGDIIFTYTDGITEATKEDDEEFGAERLLNTLNSIEETEIITIAQKMKNSIKEYTQSAPQSDDITMLIFKYNGISEIKTFKQAAIQENYKMFYSWLYDACKEWNLEQDLTYKLDMCAEEIFANIVFYAYPEKNGNIEAKLEKTYNSIIFKFEDDGIEYNPLEKPDPDVTAPPEEREIGGLGIFMIKKMADKISYKRENHKNILTLTFKI